VAFLLSLAIVALYTIPILTNIAPQGLFGIGIIVAILAGGTALASLIMYFVSPKGANFVEPLLVYLLFAATSALLIIQTGGVSSPFIMLWMLIAFFGGVFAIYGALPVFIATAVFVAAEYLSGDFNANLVAVVAFSTLLPMILGLVIWRNRGDNEETATSKRWRVNFQKLRTGQKLSLTPSETV